MERANMIYHVLPEMEPFSAFSGGAIAKNVANMTRFDSSRVVVCKAADGTWNFASEQILVTPALCIFNRIRGRKRLPVWMTNRYICHVFKLFLSRLKYGDIVWCHSQPAFCAAMERTIRANGAHLIFHSHSSLAAYPERSKLRSFTAGAYIFVSEAMRQEALALCPELKNTYVVHNGVNDKLFYPLSSWKDQGRVVPVILYVGRLCEGKGVHILMDAMRILQERKVNVLCRVVGSSFSGDSKVTPYIRSLIKSSPSNVEFMGYCIQTKIAEEYRISDIVCCPSICQDAFPGVPLEAMASGIPVVATNVGGVPEIAVDGGVMLVEPNSAVRLADALQKLVENKAVREKVAAEGLASFRRQFTWDAIDAQYKKICDNLIIKEVEVGSK
jgi:glycosyltransferase involved in cell wall biosynthesis